METVLLAILTIAEGVAIGLLIIRIKKLSILASRDGLTGLFNRREFDRLLAQAASRVQVKNGQEISLIMIDIDHFKRFNDRYGHRAGDFVLRRVADILVKGVHLTDFVCRYGGEEVAIILSGISKKVAMAIAQRLNEAVAASGLGITISLGVATFDADASSVEGLIEAADSALYRAKDGGRNQVCCA